ncbi:hypothetical protein LTR59_013640 [Friedmanniomyces endolithicus]|nr:hypothetical protein LTR94_015049 [Friedmanniomyces endolithicus]KAK0778075.1 hypothetical protein LTR59_013640 [Friedmanniomyces endolithicus]KAK0809862.1 hypothetical protein LTR38_004193 [Friedmanniomyces endolithicus]KAK0819871.1 hypothetical protein LTR75_001899 [Friedmanniomyces endolithicus]KAK0962080.1 hypothetical protein LTS01_020025 [Friedmanniomyces endolithicus]
MSGIKNAFGGGAINEGRSFADPKLLAEAMDLLEKGDCKIIDTAALYGKSEELLGQAKAGDRFTIDTKAKGGFGGAGHATKDTIIREAENSKKMLGCNVDIYYLHAPDSDTDLAETLAGINEVHKTGFFKRFGLSNYQAADVRKVHAHCKEHGYPLPSVYQGNYSAVARKQEELLFPTLRELGMAFYAYSPMAGGFLTKSKSDIEAGKGRFGTDTPLGRMYHGMYSKPAYLEALAKWDEIAKEEGVSKASLAYRWVKFNSPLSADRGDAIILGAGGLEQLKETLETINQGPLSEKAVKAIDELWEGIKHEAPLDNYHFEIFAANGEPFVQERHVT